MPEGTPFSRKHVFALLGGVLAMSFLGVVAGSYFVRQKNARAIKAPETLLKKGSVFPEFSFESLESTAVGNEELLAGKKTILMFFTSDCEHCVRTIERWDSVYNRISSAYQVIGVSFETLDKLRHFKLSKSADFLFYRDTNGKFTGQYKILKYPTLIGVGEKGQIVFVETGNWPEKSMEDYLNLL